MPMHFILDVPLCYCMHVYWSTNADFVGDVTHKPELGLLQNFFNRFLKPLEWHAPSLDMQQIIHNIPSCLQKEIMKIYVK